MFYTGNIFVFLVSAFMGLQFHSLFACTVLVGYEINLCGS